MNPFELSQVADGALRRELFASVARSRAAIASLIAHLAEFDARRLYVPEGYPSMVEFCTGALGLTRQSALKNIRVGRVARRFPPIFAALADGRLNRAAVILLAPCLSRDSAAERLAAAAGKTNDEIRLLVAGWAPKPDVPLRVEPLSADQPALEVSARTPEAGQCTGLAEVSARTPVPDIPRVAPLAPGRFEARFTMGEATHRTMGRLEQLLGRRVNADEMDRALALGLEAMARAIEKRRFGATDRPRAERRPARGRHVPAAVRRAVRARDGDRCTFVAASGRRCEARGKLEFDHIEPVARGGASTVANLRLRCRAHNQYEAEAAFGAGFMRTKRERARTARRGATTGPAAVAPAPAPAPDRADVAAAERLAAASCAWPAPDRAPVETTTQEFPAETEAAPGAARTPCGPAASADADLDVRPWLRRLGFRERELREAAARCAGMTGASLEQRVRAALVMLAPPVRGGAAAAAP